MKFTYQYRSSDNVVHHGVVSAPSRDAVYETLRAQGLKPYSVAEAPGFFNKLLGKGKRWTAIVLLAFVAVCSTIVAFRASRGGADAVTSAPRHHIYGDPTILEEIVSAGFVHVFDDEGERFLAAFAQPGEWAGTPRQIAASNLVARLFMPTPILPEDCREVVELKSIVNGMKTELREYLDGGGAVDAYVELLIERNAREAEIYKRAAKELIREADDGVRERKNAALRAVGLRTVPRPKRATMDRGENF